MVQDDERIRILEQIERGEINVDEGLRQLSTQPEAPVDQAGAMGSMLDAPAPSLALTPEVAVLSASESAPTFAREMDSSQVGWVSEPEPMPTPPEIESWKRWWRAPLAVGVVIIVASTVLMYLALQRPPHHQTLPPLRYRSSSSPRWCSVTLVKGGPHGNIKNTSRHGAV